MLRDLITSEQESNMRAEDRYDRMLDHALEMTFPASDPFTVYMPEADSAEERALDDDTHSRPHELR
jgi:hypothetical protein